MRHSVIRGVNPGYACVMYKFSAHKAWVTADKQPLTQRAAPVPSCVHECIGLCMVTADVVIGA